MVRLDNDTALITALSYNNQTNVTTGIIFQADEGEMAAIRSQLLHRVPSMSHELLTRAIILELSLQACQDHLWDAKLDLMDIEHNTGQHTFDQYISRDEKPKSDEEVSRLAHGSRIVVGVAMRRVEVILIAVDTLLDRLRAKGKDDPTGGKILEWIENMKTHARMVKLDAEFLEKRAENQVGAVSSVNFIK